MSGVERGFDRGFEVGFRACLDQIALTGLTPTTESTVVEFIRAARLSGVERETVTITMSREAAEKLADACAWGAYSAEAAAQDERLSASRRARADAVYDWFAWGSRWLLDEKARAS